LTPSQTRVIQQNALNAFNLAFAAYNVNLRAVTTANPGVGRQGTNTVYVVGQANLNSCAGTNSLAFSASVAYFPNHVTEAQYAVNQTAGNPTQSLLQAIGEGIGNNAAHEIAHQLYNEFAAFGNKIVNGMGQHDGSTDTYNGGSCKGSAAPWVYTGVGPDGTPIHWGSDADQSLLNVLGRRN
jgi:hypothetical protein